MADNQKIVSQREILERCLDIVADKDVEIKHTTTHHDVYYNGKKVFEIVKFSLPIQIQIKIDNVMFDSLFGDNGNIANDLYNKVVAKYVEQEQSRNRNVLNFLNSFTLGKQKQ